MKIHPNFIKLRQSHVMTKLKEDIHFFRALQIPTHTFISSNYCTDKDNPYGSKNIQLESYLTRSDYSLLPNRIVSSHSASYKSIQLDALVVRFLNRMTELQKRVLQNSPAKVCHFGCLLGLVS